MSFRIFLTIFHDLIIFIFSFFLALWLRLELQPSLELFGSLWIYSIGFSIMNIIILNFLGLYHGIWRYASIHEINSIFKSVLISTFAIIVVIFLTTRLEGIPRSFPILLIIISIFNSIGPRLLYRIIKDNLRSNSLTQISTLLVGDSSSSENFIRHTKTDKNSPYKIIAIISFKEKSVGRRIHNIPIIGSLENFKNIKFNILNKLKKHPERIIVSDSNVEKGVLENLFIFAKSNGLAIGQINKVSNISIAKNSFDTSPIVIEDVLGRKQNVNDTSKLVEFKNKTILITGAGGSIGSELSRQILSLQPKNLILLDNNEFSLFKISSELKSKCSYSLSDIKDTVKLDKIINKLKPDFIFHLAAQSLVFKSVQNPIFNWKTNVMGFLNIMISLSKLKKKCVGVLITSDKCYKNINKKVLYKETDTLGGIDPYSASKASSEILFKSFYETYLKNKNKFLTVCTARAGNVIGGGDWAKDRIIPDTIRAITEKNDVFLRNPKSVRPWQHVLEPISGMFWLSARMYQGENSLDEAWNFGPDNENKFFSVKEIVEMMVSKWESETNIEIINNPDEPFESKILKIDPSKASSILEWKNVYSVEEAIGETVSWYKTFYEIYCNDDTYFLSKQNNKFQWYQKHE